MKEIVSRVKRKDNGGKCSQRKEELRLKESEKKQICFVGK